VLSKILFVVVRTQLICDIAHIPWLMNQRSLRGNKENLQNQPFQLNNLFV